MAFARDTQEALGAAVWLVNSAEEPDSLDGLDVLEAFFDDWGYTGARPRGERDLVEVRRIRADLRALVLADRDEAVHRVNTILTEQGASPRLVRHDDTDWHLHAVDDDRPLAERILVETAMAMIDVIRADELSRLEICAGDDCRGVVLDLSRNRSRKFCSTACGNRAAVAAYRARRA